MLSLTIPESVISFSWKGGRFNNLLAIASSFEILLKLVNWHIKLSLKENDLPLYREGCSGYGVRHSVQDWLTYQVRREYPKNATLHYFS